MVSSDGFVKVVDFGLAKLVEAGGSDDVTRVGGTSPDVVMGSAGYMSPEQASGREVDYRSDQFALGLLVYEMATGVRPRSSGASDPARGRHAHDREASAASATM
jgi:eukaryotic-like serine/threonine-protein kinase